MTLVHDPVHDLPTIAQSLIPRDDDLTGWALHDSEKRDFNHRIRVFPPDVAAWRKRKVQQVQLDRKLFSRLTGLETDKEVRDLFDRGVTVIREIARLLALLYRTPRLGNPFDPVDELVYIMLSRKTREAAYQACYGALKKRFRSWDDLLDASPDEVEAILTSGGLVGKKVSGLFAALGTLRDTFGSCTLEPAMSWSDEALETFLCSIPEISRKSAYCIMMYAFGRAVFPVDTHVGRILSRLGIYAELGLDLSGKDHKQLQAILADMIPPNLRYSLHVNLLVHGKEVCKAQNPDCGHCELRNFCATYRAEASAQLAASNAPTMIDLFSGAGGLSEGFMRAGFRPLLVIDKYTEALRSYRYNHPNVPENRVLDVDITRLSLEDIRKIIGDERVDVLVGSPPCQGFSSAGFRSKASKFNWKLEEDERNHLYRHMIDIALEFKPRLFLMENVPGMESLRVQGEPSFLHRAADLLTEGGYRTKIWHLNAAAYGIPQDRNRCFLVAWQGISEPRRPKADYQDTSGSEAKDPDAEFEFDAESLLPPLGVGDAIFDLPPREANHAIAVELDPRTTVETSRRGQQFLQRLNGQACSKLLFNHFVRYHNDRDLALYARMGQGENSVDAIRNGLDDLMVYRRDVFDDKYSRLHEDKPSRTIVAHLSKDGNAYIHPRQARSISLREAARLQTFHDGYVFCGAPSDQWIQVGNAVPPLLAEVIAKSYLKALKGRKTL